MDGFCKRIDGDGPNVFVEIQGYADPKIYWRAMREIATYYEQHDDPNPFLLIVLFLDDKYDPGYNPLASVALPHRCIRATLQECLTAIWDRAGTLTVLKPLAISRQEQVFDDISHWKQDLQALDIPEEKIRTLLDLLEYLIMQRFPRINRKEVEAMLHLTPIEETVIGQELIGIGEKRGRKQGEQKGLTKGELIGQIQRTQRMLKRPVSSKKSLIEQSSCALKQMPRQLEADAREYGSDKWELIGKIQQTQRFLKRAVFSVQDLAVYSLNTLNQMLSELEQKADEHGFDKGELIGEIRLAQKVLKRPVQTVEELAQTPMADLKEMAQVYEAELAKLN